MERISYDENSARSWSWHCQFVGQICQHNYRLYHIAGDIIQANLQIKSIIELGTGRGALTMFLGLWGLRLRLPVVTTDITDGRCLDVLHVFDALNVKFIKADEFKPETDELLLEVIKEQPTLFFCDGANKNWEFNHWATRLPRQSVIGVHDFGVESHMEDMKQVADQYCEPIFTDRWMEMNAQTAWFKVK